MASTDAYESARRSPPRDHEASGDRSFTALFKELRDETTTLVREEVALAKTEMSEKASKFGRNTGYLMIGGVIATAGIQVLLLAGCAGLYVGLVAAGLSHFTAGWLAPLIIGAVIAVIGLALVMKAVATFKHESLVPQRTLKTLQDDTSWVKQKVVAQ